MPNVGEDDIIRLTRQLAEYEPSSEVTSRAISRVKQALTEDRCAQQGRSQDADEGEAQIIRHMDSLARIELNEKVAQRAINRTRLALMANGRTGGFRLLRKLFMRSGIAAAILLMTFIMYLFFYVPSAQGSVSLQEVLQAVNSYGGWICIRLDKVQDIMQPASGPRIHSWVRYAAPSEGKDALVMQFEDGSSKIWWRSRIEHIDCIYRSDSHDMHIESTSQDWREVAQITFGMPLQPNIPTLLEMLERKFGSNAYDIGQTEEGKLLRFDVTFAERIWNKIPLKGLVIWANPETRLIEKWKGILHTGGDLVYSFEYGIAPLKDVYALGVPRDATVVDDRPSPEVEALLDRLDDRIGPKEALGNYVAIIQCLTEDGGDTATLSELQMFARLDNVWVNMNYWNSQAMEVCNSLKRQVPDLVEKLRDVRPDWFLFYDGLHCWQGKYNQAERAYKYHEEIKEKAKQVSALRLASLSASIWPGRRIFDYSHIPYANVHLEVVTDSSHQGLVGLDVHISNMQQYGSDPQPTESRETFWLDPTRDDMPIERIKQYYLSDRILSKEVHVRYLAYAQLKGGQWHPTHWLSTTTDYSEGKPVRVRNEHYYLEIIPDMQLDPIWLTNPVERFKDKR